MFGREPQNMECSNCGETRADVRWSKVKEDWESFFCEDCLQMLKARFGVK